jgi:predicted alpha/beta hydrolase
MRAGIILLVVAAVLATPVVLLWAFQRRLLYFPTPGTVPPAASVLPGAEEVVLATADGLRLAAWFVPAQPRGEPGEGPGGAGPAVLVCNGNGGDRSMRVPLAAALARMGLHVLLFDYRGLSAVGRRVIDTDRTDVPMMGLQRELDRVGPSAGDPPPDGVSLVLRGDASGASGASEPAHGAGRSECGDVCAGCGAGSFRSGLLP